jgi:hypothetical protein
MMHDREKSDPAIVAECVARQGVLAWQHPRAVTPAVWSAGAGAE